LSLEATTSQTVGPFFSIGLRGLYVADLAPPGATGERIAVEGRIVDGDGAPVPDALLELWQANAQGRYAHPEDTQNKPLDPAFRGYGRVPTDADGRFRFASIKPGPVPGAGGKVQAPHIVISLFARGLQRRLVTRLYFPDDPRNESCPILSLVPGDRRSTLIARPGARPGMLEWDVVLQGPAETVFFDC